MSVLHLDLETRSACDLTVAGAHVYAEHETTEFLCIGFAFDEEPTEAVDPGDFNFRIADHIKAGGLVYAHNAQFERVLWNAVGTKRYHYPPLKQEQLRCTMTMAYAMALPGSLEKAAAAVGLEMQKDLKGQRVMLQLSKPRDVTDFGDPVWWDDAEKLATVFDYCRQDVEVERALHKRLLELSGREQQLWDLDQKINDRGIRIDSGAAVRAIELAHVHSEKLHERMRELTGGAVALCSETKRIKDFIKNEGIPIESLAKSEAGDLLLDESLPPRVREIIETRLEFAKTSVKKISAMKEGVTADNERVRGCFQYSGAGTRRWAGRRIQFQNLPKPILIKDKPQEIEDVFSLLNSKKKISEVLQEIELFYGSPLTVLADCIRGFLVPAAGNKFLVSDWAAIESRALNWLAGEERILQIYRVHGKIYEFNASIIYHVPLDRVTKDQRQIGKVAELALGYGGGKGAFLKMAEGYGVKVPEAEAEKIKVAWRQSHPLIVRYWYDVERAATNAVLRKGEMFSVGPKNRQVKFKVSGSFLWCRLPSGGTICYPYPKVGPVETPWGETKDGLTYMGVDAITKKWQREKTFGGKLVENICQSLCRDILADTLFELERKGYPVVIHVHDEVVVEVPKNSTTHTLKEMNEIMETASKAWAIDLPLKAEGWEGFRFRK